MPSVARSAIKRRKALRKEHWTGESPWLGPEESGYFCGPRSLPYILQALSSKSVSGGRDLAPVYLDLLANHMGQGVVELSHADDHMFAAGYAQQRTWRDRMQALEGAGFIKTTVSGSKKYAKVFLIHPSIAMQRLRDQGKIPDSLWNEYRERQMKMKEATRDEVEERKGINE